MRVEADGNARAWIAFAGAAPSAAVDLIRTFPEPLAIREHCGYTEVARKDRLEEIHYAIWNRQDLVAKVSSGYDTATGVITVFVEPREPGDSASRSRLQRQLVADLSPGPSTMPVDLRVLNRVPSSDDTVYGGRPLQPVCTTGFNVVGVVTRGIATAGHCRNGLTYFGRSFRFINEHEGSFGDLQWHTRDGESHPNQFYNGSELRPVARTRAAQEGSRVCLYGKSTGSHCDDVYQLNHCANGSCALVAMQNDRASGGDSGGPWYFGVSAYGIHKGSKWHFGSRDLYTPVVFLPDALGVQVATS